MTLASFDIANRLEFYVRTDAAGNEIVSAELTYLDNGLPATITYGDGTQTLYDFDLANRLIEIWHKNAAEATIHKLNYDWSPDGLVDSITETDDTGAVSTIDFTYDRGNRLTKEVRGGTNPYHLRYTYDAAGNRLTKEDLLAGLHHTRGRPGSNAL